MKRLLVSAAHKSSGKTTVCIGLCAALRARGEIVQPFKKGPDYIDPQWLSLAADKPCYNLDPYLSSAEEIRTEAALRLQGASLCLIEGNKGLYDGLDLDGSNSNAALASMLEAPVVLVIDARGMTRGIAPLLLGYQAFDRSVRIAGVILNQLGGSRHEAKLRAVIAHYTDIPVLGAMQHDDSLLIRERHLGLIPGNEAPQAREFVDRIAKAVTAQVALDRVLAVANQAPPLPAATAPTVSPASPRGGRVRLGVARDAAFGFYYPGDLQALIAAGADIVTFDAVNDRVLPEVDGLFIGGGFPETCMEALAANTAMRSAVRDAVESAMPVYAECGGLMYLARGICWGGRSAAMAGAIPADIVMHQRPVGRGYVHLRETGNSPWSVAPSAGCLLRAHEFHHAGIENLQAGARYAYAVERGHGLDGLHDGIVYKNTVASFSHLRNVSASPWAGRFVEFVRSCRDGTRHG